MKLLVLLYLATGVETWLLISGPDSALVKGRYSTGAVIVATVLSILLWPRLAYAMVVGK